jgi:hypothetical protein
MPARTGAVAIATIVSAGENTNSDYTAGIRYSGLGARPFGELSAALSKIEGRDSPDNCAAGCAWGCPARALEPGAWLSVRDAY